MTPPPRSASRSARRGSRCTTSSREALARRAATRSRAAAAGARRSWRRPAPRGRATRACRASSISRFERVVDRGRRRQSGQSVRCTDSSVPARFVYMSSVMNGQNGASSCVMTRQRLVQASRARRDRTTSRSAAATGARTSWTGRRRARPAPARRPARRSRSSASVTVRTVRCRRDRTHRSRTWVAGAAAAAGRRPAVEVGVRDEERVRVPQRQQELAGRLVDAVDRDALRRPRRARREHVPAQRVGAPFAQDRHRVDDVAARLRHLRAVLSTMCERHTTLRYGVVSKTSVFTASSE